MVMSPIQLLTRRLTRCLAGSLPSSITALWFSEHNSQISTLPTRSPRALCGSLTFALITLLSPRLVLAQRSAELPPPPQIIAPDNLIRPEEVNLEPAKAKELERKYKNDADQAYARADYKETLIALQRAYLISKNPRYIANQGLVLEKLGRYEEAIQALEYFLLTGPPPEKKLAAQKVISNLKPEVKITTDPSKAKVLIDGQELSGQVTPLTLNLIAGKHLLEIRLRGYETFKTNLFVEAGKSISAQYSLQLDARAMMEEERRIAEQIKSPELPPINSAQMSSLAVGAVSLGIGAVSLWASRDALIERDSARNSESWAVAQREAESFSTLGYSAAGVGITALIGGVTWWLLSEPPSSGTSRARGAQATR